MRAMGAPQIWAASKTSSSNVSSGAVSRILHRCRASILSNSLFGTTIFLGRIEPVYFFSSEISRLAEGTNSAKEISTHGPSWESNSSLKIGSAFILHLTGGTFRQSSADRIAYLQELLVFTSVRHFRTIFYRL